jgi:glycosyltransferase 2 family protein
LANVTAIITHVPGGLGVIEAIVLSLVPGANVVGALIAFRALYYLIPFLIGGVVLAISEVVRRQHRPVAEPGPSD